ncbi:DUF3130 domain-containing protein [Listeria seeligeri]|uniref:DUF3130 domain-containing protein n=1 Tax=Listeria seeligeri TaxID=1640 RepID=UPI0022EBA3A5|nr:DUF3130 domain-containing protein [Listeria seeligeri]
MTKINVNEETLKDYATKLKDKGEAVEYLPMQGGNMSYSRANSINHFQTAMFDLVEVVDEFQSIVSTDAKRLKQLGASFTKKDNELKQKMGLKGK